MWLNQDQKVIVKGDMSARDYKRLVEVALSSLSSGSDEGMKLGRSWPAFSVGSSAADWRTHTTHSSLVFASRT